MPNLKLKFETANLLAKAEARREREVKETGKAVEKYLRESGKIAPKVADELEAAAARVRETGEVPTVGGYEDRRYLEVPSSLKVPNKPRLDTERWDILITGLRETTNQTVTLDPRELAYYDLDEVK